MNRLLEVAALIDHQLTELQHPRRQLTRWELDFLTSITNQWEQRGFLSDKQQSILARIYKERAE